MIGSLGSIPCLFTSGDGAGNRGDPGGDGNAIGVAETQLRACRLQDSGPEGDQLTRSYDSVHLEAASPTKRED